MPKFAENPDSIKFDKMFNKFRNRTENNYPFTIQQMEDVMFIDEKRVVALEYIFYQSREDYRKIKNKNAGDLVG
jgi:hypothetical protein